MIYFLIPLYNEEQNIPELAHNLMGVLSEEEKHFVLVNDCSTDQTLSAIDRHFPSEKTTVLTNPSNAGPGYSFNHGFEHILNMADTSDLVVTIEGDNTSDLAILPVMHANAKMGYSLVLASVYAQGGGFDQTSFLRKALSFTANITLRSILDIKVLTLSSFYRIYHVELLKKIQANHHKVISETGFICMLEVLMKALHAKAKVIEVPMVLHSKKRKGKSKMKLIKTSWEYVVFLFKTLLGRNDVSPKKN